ncbi:acetyltransferase [bacterium]|nr:acetyltransferase [bacterium]
MKQAERELTIIGTGGHARVVIDAAELTGYRVRGLVDLAYTGADEQILGHPVLGGPGLLEKGGITGAVCIAVGDNRVRRTWFERAVKQGMRLPAIVHPAAVVSEHAAIGAGVFVNAGVIVNAGAVIGDNVILNSGAVVDHETVIGDHCHIAPGARIAGRVRVGALSFIGIGASVIDGITIGEAVTAGAGSVVIRDVPGNTTVAGVPAGTIR